MTGSLRNVFFISVNVDDFLCLSDLSWLLLNVTLFDPFGRVKEKRKTSRNNSCLRRSAKWRIILMVFQIFSEES